MGRIKGTQIKALTEHMIKQNPGAFSADFDEDKKILDSLQLGMDKTTKNKLAGEIAVEIAKLDRLARDDAPEAKPVAAHKTA